LCEKYLPATEVVLLKYKLGGNKVISKIFRKFVPEINNNNMEAVLIQTRGKSDVKFLKDFAQRIGVKAKAINTETSRDKYLVSLIEQGLKTENVSRDEVMTALGK